MARFKAEQNRRSGSISERHNETRKKTALCYTENAPKRRGPRSYNSGVNPDRRDERGGFRPFLLFGQ